MCIKYILSMRHYTLTPLTLCTYVYTILRSTITTYNKFDNIFFSMIALCCIVLNRFYYIFFFF